MASARAPSVGVVVEPGYGRTCANWAPSALAPLGRRLKVVVLEGGHHTVTLSLGGAEFCRDFSPGPHRLGNRASYLLSFVGA